MRRLLKHCAVRVAPLVALAAVLLTCAATISSAERIKRSINVGGMQREYIVHLPDALGSKATWPVLVAFHPGFANASDFERISQLHAAPGAQRFIVVYPDGFRRSWNVEECCGAALRRNVDDLGFFQAMMSDLGNFAPVRPRAYLTGFSNGAKMTYYLMCNLPGMVAAAAPVGGSITLNDCRTNRAIPLLHIQGALDDFAPLRGGMSARGQAGMQPSIIENVSFFADQNSCSKTFTSTLVADVTCDNWTGCANGANVALCIVPNLGHLWPGGTSGFLGSTMGLGPARPEIPASREIVNFFLNNIQE